MIPDKDAPERKFTFPQVKDTASGEADKNKLFGLAHHASHDIGGQESFLAIKTLKTELSV